MHMNTRNVFFNLVLMGHNVLTLIHLFMRKIFFNLTSFWFHFFIHKYVFLHILTQIKWEGLKLIFHIEFWYNNSMILNIFAFYQTYKKGKILDTRIFFADFTSTRFLQDCIAGLNSRTATPFATSTSLSCSRYFRSFFRDVRHLKCILFFIMRLKSVSTSSLRHIQTRRYGYSERKQKFNSMHKLNNRWRIQQNFALFITGSTRFVVTS